MGYARTTCGVMVWSLVERGPVWGDSPHRPPSFTRGSLEQRQGRKGSGRSGRGATRRSCKEESSDRRLPAGVGLLSMTGSSPWRPTLYPSTMPTQVA